MERLDSRVGVGEDLLDLIPEPRHQSKDVLGQHHIPHTKDSLDHRR